LEKRGKWELVERHMLVRKIKDICVINGYGRYREKMVTDGKKTYVGGGKKRHLCNHGICVGKERKMEKHMVVRREKSLLCN
jgi:hypothetical protein